MEQSARSSCSRSKTLVRKYRIGGRLRRRGGQYHSSCGGGSKECPTRRELEVLDEITRLKFEGKLPVSVNGMYRRRLIRSYYAWKSDVRDPPHFHPAMRWKKEMGPRVPEAVSYSEWKPSIKPNLKRKNAVVEYEREYKKPLDGPAKKRRLDNGLNLSHTVVRANPIGLIWDQLNYSCA